MKDASGHRLAQISSMTEVDAAAWNSLAGDNPFLRHEFLSALESAGCVGTGTAWEPSHLVLHAADGGLLGALPLFLKYDSRGEFVFDWSWADAYERAGFHYYPKLICAAPFTPATGTRVLTAQSEDVRAIQRQLIAGGIDLARESKLSSFHVLFPSDDQRDLFQAAGMLERKGCQFHWSNEAYTSFDEFLGRFSSAKRKKAKRERRRIKEAGIEFEHLDGAAPTPKEWDAIYEFYARTFLRRGREPYLNRTFFELVSKSMADNLVIILARFEGQPIATAICFRSEDTLYGRYWGSLADFHSLHFEACYYQGIDYCIMHGLERFEPGTQGEHKISRGFTPTATWSYHWLSQPGFHEAIGDFLKRETTHVDAYIDDLEGHVPYRRDRLNESRQ